MGPHIVKLSQNVKNNAKSNKITQFVIYVSHEKDSKRKISDSDPDGKGFRQFGVCMSCAMCPSCSLTNWLPYSGFCEYYTPLTQ